MFRKMELFLGVTAVSALIAFPDVLGAQQLAPVPPGPFELATAGVHTVDSPEERARLLRLMDRAREYYTLTDARLPFHLKTSFTVTSNGATRFDGAWQMEETFAPGLGTLFTAETAGYALRQLRTAGLLYQSPQGNIPLRLHEAIGHLLTPLESRAKAERDSIRTVNADLNGKAVTCLLLADAQRTTPFGDSPGRSWQEREECIDPNTGHLLLHSPAPGLAILYEFSGDLRFHGKELPNKLTVTENGATVLLEHVEKLEDVTALDSRLFEPTEEMQGQGTALSGRLYVTYGGIEPADTTQSVVVFGLLGPDGTITEAHPLQASHSDLVPSALAKVAKIRRPVSVAPGANPEQHEFFVVMHFAPK